MFTVVGDGVRRQRFRFNDIELITDKREYQPGDKVKLQINTNRNDGTVLLFVRPTNGVYLAPKVLRLNGKSTTSGIRSRRRRTCRTSSSRPSRSRDGKIYTDVREIVVPPEKRVLNVDSRALGQDLQAGDKAQVQVKLTDFAGKPFVGSTVLTIYDKCWNTSPADRTCRRSRTSSGNGAAPIFRSPNPA